MNRRTMLASLISVVLGTILFYWRIPQLSVFLLAAGIRRRWHPNCRMSGSGNVLPPAGQRSTAYSNPEIFEGGGLVTYHPEYHCFSPKWVAESILRAQAMGFRWLRSDARWFEILPDRKHLSQQSLDWYRWFFSSIRDSGLRTMIVLGSPPSNWSAQTDADLSDWKRYIKATCSHLRGIGNAYQVLNEPNNPFYSLFRMEDAARAIKIAAEIIRSEDPNARIAVNIALDIFGWREYLSGLLSRCGDSIDIVGFDYYPGTWSMGQASHWDRLLHFVAENTRDEGALSGKIVGIMETGYSTNAPSRSQEEQAHYYRRLRPVIQNLSKILPADRLLVGIYELSDGETANSFDPEAHFGVLTSTLGVKAGAREISDLLIQISG